MNACLLLLNLVFCSHFVICRDFYIGMFKRNDFLVAQDVIYKEASHFGYAYASYGRLFKCPITFFRVVDRLGMGRGPYTSIVRGGLRKKYIAVRIKSTYNLPVSVNIYVGCENKGLSTTRMISIATDATTVADGAGSANTSDAGNMTLGNDTSAGNSSDAPVSTTQEEPGG